MMCGVNSLSYIWRGWLDRVGGCKDCIPETADLVAVQQLILSKSALIELTNSLQWN